MKQPFFVLSTKLFILICFLLYNLLSLQKNIMGKVTKVKNHLSNDELEKKIKETVGFWRVQKWLIIYNAQNYPRTSEEIANHLAVSKALVNKTVSEYNRFGVAAIETVGRGGRKNAYMSVEQEKEFVGSYISRSQKGQIVTVQEIQEDFEKAVGKKVNKTTIYRLLKRHGWRKVMPRSFHPKRDKEKQTAFKKTSRTK